MRFVGWIFCAGVWLAATLATASPVVNLGHYYVPLGGSQSFAFSVSDAGNPAIQDIEGMTFTLQIASGTSSAPAIGAIDFLTSTIWTGHVSPANVIPAAGSGPQFKSFTLITNNAGEFVNANGTLATVTFSSFTAKVGDYALRMTGTKDPGSDSQFTDGLGNLVPATFDNGTLTIVAPGDFNRDTLVNAVDIPVMLAALADLNAYKSARGLSDAGLVAIGDLNNDQSVGNADLQSLLTLLKSGGGSIDAVPEPASWSLAALAIAAFLGVILRGKGSGVVFSGANSD